MATHTSILAWRIPWTEEPGVLPSMGLQRVGYNRATNMCPTFYEPLEYGESDRCNPVFMEINLDGGVIKQLLKRMGEGWASVAGRGNSIPEI